MRKVVSTVNITPEQKLLLKNWEKSRGSIVLVVGETIFSTKRGAGVGKILEKIEKQFHKRPLITYIPKEGSLVLFL